MSYSNQATAEGQSNKSTRVEVNETGRNIANQLDQLGYDTHYEWGAVEQDELGHGINPMYIEISGTETKPLNTDEVNDLIKDTKLKVVKSPYTTSATKNGIDNTNGSPMIISPIANSVHTQRDIEENTISHL